MGYSFKMQRTNKSGTAQGSAKDLESDFQGLTYLSITGVESIGKPKNVYTEDYAEESGLRVYHPSDSNGSVAYSATEVELTLLFFGDNRRAQYGAFCSFVEGGRVYYWDTARNKKMWLVLKEEVAPSDDTLKGAKYIRASFKFSNLWGISKSCNANGVLL